MIGLSPARSGFSIIPSRIAAGSVQRVLRFIERGIVIGKLPPRFVCIPTGILGFVLKPVGSRHVIGARRGSFREARCRVSSEELAEPVRQEHATGHSACGRQRRREETART